MASFDYNPITGQLDLVGSGGGTSYIDGDVEYHSNLPVTVGTPAVNSAFLVRKGEGLYFISRKPAGIWVRELNNGNLDDWKYAGTFSDLYRDANFRILNNADVSKELAFDVSGVTTGTTRTLTVPNASGTIALTSDIPKAPSTNLWIPASAWIPKTTAGCGVDSRETATNDQNFDELLFDTGSDEFADALVVMPSNYSNGTTIAARFYWTASSGSGGVAWAIQGRAFANDDALDTAAGTAQLVTDTLITANDMHITAATSAVTIGGTPAANTPIQFTIYRDVSDAGDDLAVDARLLGVEIIYTAA